MNETCHPVIEKCMHIGVNCRQKFLSKLLLFVGLSECWWHCLKRFVESHNILKGRHVRCKDLDRLHFSCFFLHESKIYRSYSFSCHYPSVSYCNQKVILKPWISFMFTSRTEVGLTLHWARPMIHDAISLRHNRQFDMLAPVSPATDRGRKHRALRPQKPLRLIRDGEVGGRELYI